MSSTDSEDYTWKHKVKLVAVKSDVELNFEQVDLNFTPDLENLIGQPPDHPIHLGSAPKMYPIAYCVHFILCKSLNLMDRVHPLLDITRTILQHLFPGGSNHATSNPFG